MGPSQSTIFWFLDWETNWNNWNKKWSVNTVAIVLVSITKDVLEYWLEYLYLYCITKDVLEYWLKYLYLYCITKDVLEYWLKYLYLYCITNDVLE